jgi:hypothetical protein
MRPYFRRRLIIKTDPRASLSQREAILLRLRARCRGHRRPGADLRASRPISDGIFNDLTQAVMVSALCYPRSRAAANMPPHAPPRMRFSKPIVLRDSAPLATLDDARAFLASLSPAQVTPAFCYARVTLGVALRTGKSRDIEKARSELMKAVRAARGGRRTLRRAPSCG